ncbi:MAG: hypothetical protein AUJ55_04875 [Proteobacteria bacterium CG1_02_64_396]|nr:MAG: hypothetical protein AUJ55_04875 [Proteobacteria bacterium CG1_02_64_396]
MSGFEFDVVVIGGGPGGYVCAVEAARRGLKTALIEAGALGGECTNWGCIPTKALHAVAKMMKAPQGAARLGVNLGAAQLDWGKAKGHVQRVVKSSRMGIERLLKDAGVETMGGWGRIEGPHLVSIDGERRIAARHIVIATGSRPAEISGLAGITNRDLFDLEALPERLLIVGGGVIGVEFAAIAAALGSKVTVVEATERLLPGVDPEVAQALTGALQRGGVTIRTGCLVRGAEAGVATVEGLSEPVGFDELLVAVGRRPNTGVGDLAALGIDVGRFGIEVDAQCRTTLPSVFAIGDVAGQGLAHVASRQGEVVAEVLAGIDGRFEGRAIPACIFAFPEAATVGAVSNRSARINLAANGRARTLNATDGFVQLYAGEDGAICGGSIVGIEASELIAPVALAVQLKLTPSVFAKTVAAHPTLGEAVREAALLLGEGA